jgi:hypothetical protein
MSYPCNVEFDRYFVSGNLEGLTYSDKMGFMSWNDACKWAGKVTQSHSVDYVIRTMKNLETGEIAQF